MKPRTIVKETKPLFMLLTVVLLNPFVELVDEIFFICFVWPILAHYGSMWLVVAHCGPLLTTPWPENIIAFVQNLPF